MSEESRRQILEALGALQTTRETLEAIQYYVDQDTDYDTYKALEDAMDGILDAETALEDATALEED